VVWTYELSFAILLYGVRFGYGPDCVQAEVVSVRLYEICCNATSGFKIG
jgi:hypothetical protein